MKRIVVIFVLLACIACSNDSNSDNTEDVLTLEVFNLISYEINTSLDFNDDGVSSTNLKEEIGCFRNQKLYVRSDGTGTSFSQGDPVYREFIDEFCNCISKFVNCDVISVTHEFVWEQNGIIIETEGQTINAIGTKTDTEFELTIENGFTFKIINDEGEQIEVTEDVTYKYMLIE